MDKEEKARIKAEKKAAKANKKHWWNYLPEAYNIVKEQYSWAPIAIWGSLTLIVVAFTALAIFTAHHVSFAIWGVLLAVTVPFMILTWLIKPATFKQVDGMPGVAGWVIGQIKRGWVVSEEPVRFNPRSKDLIYRAIGRPGVVLIGEGNPTQVSKLIGEERRAIKRVAPSAPVSSLVIGHGEKQVPASKLLSTMKRMPKQLTNQEVAAIAQRLEAVQTNTLGIPKGMDPTKMRANRRALRG